MAVANLADHAARAEEIVADGSLDPPAKVRALRDLAGEVRFNRKGQPGGSDEERDATVVGGRIDQYIGALELQREAEALSMVMELALVREDADVREALRAEGVSDADLDAAGLPTHEDLDAREAEGTLQEALGAFGAALDPALLAKLARGRRRNKGRFAEEFGAPKKVKGRGGKALPGQGTPNRPGGSSAEARAKATAAAEFPDRFSKASPPAKTAPARQVELYKGSGAPEGVGIVRKDESWIDVGSDVQKAADLLGQGKKVSLSQPREVSTLLTELAKRVQEAKEKGDAAPSYDLCKVTVKGTNLFCTQSKGIPRVKMPQLSGRPLPGSPAEAMADEDGKVDLAQHFREMLVANGAKVTDETQKASHLRASQMELNGGKVAGMVGALEANDGELSGDPRIFTSHDDYIVDGHHRWAANVGYDLADGELGDIDMPIARVDMDILELLETANRYAQEMGIPQAAVGENSEDAAKRGESVAPPMSPGTEGADPRRAEVDAAVKEMYRPEEAEPAVQNFDSLDHLYAAAEASNDALKGLLTEGLPDVIGATVPSFEEALDTAKNRPEQPQVLMGPMKKRKRAEEKVEANYDGDHNQLKDVIRATVLVGEAGELPGVLDAVRARAAEQGWTIRGAEDKFSDGPPPPWVKGPTSAGYSDTKVFLVSPQGVAAELQFNTNSMFIAKEGDGHKLYEAQRTLEAQIKKRARTAADRDALRQDESSLPENGELFFNLSSAELSRKYGAVLPDNALQEVPLSKITPVRARPEGIANAEPLMTRAALGEGGKRDPITLVRDGDGYRVYDGNSTFAIAQKHGWSKIPAIVVDSDEQAAEIERVAKKAKAKVPEPPMSPGTQPHHGPTADEISRLRSLKAEQQRLYTEARMAGYGRRAA